MAERIAYSDLAMWVVFAQAKDGAEKKAADDAGPFGGSLLTFAPLVIIMVLFYFMMMRPQQRERAKMQEMLNNLKKNERVLLRSGIVGTIVNVQKDSVYATVKIDESTNTKVRVLRTSIEKVITDEDDGDKNSDGA
ncbi:MAG: preprotein translocase subunit YajC [Pirellulaceae bacterium]